MRAHVLVSLWLVFGLTACAQRVNPAQTQVPAPTRVESTATVQSLTSPTPVADLPETGAQPVPQQWACAQGELPAAQESAQVRMGPGRDIPASNAPGEPLKISAVLYTEDCQALSGASINLWQTDPQGVYGPGHGTNEMQCCYYLGTVTTDENGRFDILTVVPGAYQGETAPPPAHIHVEIMHPDLPAWQTEIVFRGDPHLPSTIPQGMIPITLAEQTNAEDAGDGQSTAYYGEAEIITPFSSQDLTGQGALPASPGRYILRPGASYAAYQIRERFADFASMVSAKGITEQVEGEFQLDENLAPLPDSVRITVDLRGLKTDDPLRDEKLFDRWLVMNEYPFASFSSTEVEGFPPQIAEGETVDFTLTGNLTIRDVTQAVSFDISAALQNERMIGDAQTTIRMTDFGIQPPDLLGFVKVEDEVVLEVHLEAEADSG